MPKQTEKELTYRQKLFVDNYLVYGEAAKAAVAAGFSPHRANQQGYQLLQKPHIQKYIEERLNQSAMTANEVLAELADIAKSEWRDFIELVYDKDGTVVEAKIRLSDKIKALELLGKNHKLFTDRVESNTTVSFATFEIATKPEPSDDE